MVSAVWSYFKIDESDHKYAKCNICQKSISRGGGNVASKSTSNLMNHLKTHKISITTKSKSSTSNIAKPISVAGASLFSFVQKNNKPRPSSTTVSGEHEEDKDQHSHISEEEVSEDDHDDPSEGNSASVSPRGPIFPKRVKMSKSRQPTLIDTQDKMTKFKPNDYRAVHINQLIGEMICKDLQPISVVENEGFCRLISYLEPRYTIPTRKTFSAKVLVDMYNTVLERVQQEMMAVKYVSLTIDMWTNICQTDFMAVTVHFVSENDVREHRCLEVVPFPEVSHTGIHLRDFLTKILQEWNLEEKVVAVVRDNGPDITSALESSDFVAVPCVAHTLQLIVKDGFFNHAKINNTVAKARKLVGSFKHSTKNTKALKAVQITLGLAQHKMIQDEPTRWNSSYYMLRRLHEQRQAITLLSANPDVKLSVEFTNEDWETVEFGIDILEIFETASLQLCKEAASVSEIIPMINTIQHVLETRAPQGSGLQGLKDDLLASLKRRYRNVEENPLFACATLLDPRFKTTPFKDPANIESAKSKIVLDMAEFCSTVPLGEVREDSATGSQGEVELRKKSKLGFWHHYKEAFGTSPPIKEETGFDIELSRYLGESYKIDPKNGEQIFTYWSRSAHQNLKNIAFKYLSIPPCTVFSERLFSLAGNICEAKRNRLDPEKVKMLVFLNKNLK